MKPGFVETRNVREFHSKLSELQNRGAEEACMMVVDGAPGLGKTTTMSRWVAQTGSVFVRAHVGWDYAFLIDSLLKEMGMEPPRGKVRRYELLTQALAERSLNAQLQNQIFGLVIDECDLVSSRREIMEAIRGLSDILTLPTILVGMGKLRENLRRFPQIESRAPRKVKFLPATFEDTRDLFKARCEVPVADDLTDFIWRVSKGFNREILEGIAHVERLGQRIDFGAEGITLRDMSGQVVMVDRDSGNPIHAPKVA
tara:strand:- start:30095 stop:30862 length:768 start_codon:yes stop_codon:yes gene_type:complete